MTDSTLPQSLVVLGATALAPCIPQHMPGYDRYIVLLDQDSPMIKVLGLETMHDALEHYFGSATARRPHLHEVDFPNRMSICCDRSWHTGILPQGDVLIMGSDWVLGWNPCLLSTRNVFTVCHLSIPVAKRVHILDAPIGLCGCTARETVHFGSVGDPHACIQRVKGPVAHDIVEGPECVVCTNPIPPHKASTVCPRCGTQTCSPCLAMMSLTSTSPSTWQCPACRLPVCVETLNLVSHMPRGRSFASVRRAIAHAMAELGVKFAVAGFQAASLLGISTQWTEMVLCDPEFARPVVYDDCVPPSGAHFFVVGTAPIKCAPCRCIHRNNLDQGFAFVYEGGVVCELPGAFGLLIARARSGNQHGALGGQHGTAEDSDGAADSSSINSESDMDTSTTEESSTESTAFQADTLPWRLLAAAVTASAGPGQDGRCPSTCEEGGTDSGWETDDDPLAPA